MGMEKLAEWGKFDGVGSGEEEDDGGVDPEEARRRRLWP